MRELEFSRYLPLAALRCLEMISVAVLELLRILITSFYTVHFDGGALAGAVHAGEA